MREQSPRTLWTPERKIIKPLEMRTYGNPEVLRSWRAGERPAKGKRAIIALDGGQAGVIAGGAFAGMQDAGVLPNADAIITVSTSIPCMEYLASGQGIDAVSLYWTHNTTGDFIKIPKTPRQVARAIWSMSGAGPESPLIDTMLVGQHMRNVIPLDVDALRNTDQELIAVLMNVDTATPAYLDVRHAEDPISVMEAGTCVPGVSSVRHVVIDGIPYADGGFVDPIPVQFAFDHGYSDLILISNFPLRGPEKFFDKQVPFMLSHLARRTGYAYDPKVIAKIGNYQRQLDYMWQFVLGTIQAESPYRRIVIIAPENNVISSTEDNPAVLESGYWESRESVGNLLRP